MHAAPLAALVLAPFVQEPEAEGSVEPAPSLVRAGEAAPELAPAAWLNHGADAPPTVAAFAGKPAVLVFWASDSPVCHALLPQVSELVERFAPEGVGFAMLSDEPEDALAAWLKDHELPAAIGADPDRVTIDRYGVKRWPTTYVIDSAGHVAFVGTPAGASSVLEAALGMVSEAETLLSACVDALLRRDEEAALSRLCTLVERAPVDFDLQGWAAASLGVERGTSGSAADGAKALDELAKSALGGNKRNRKRAIEWLAEQGPAVFDLRAWSLRMLRTHDSVAEAEIRSLLEEQRYDDVIFALLHREAGEACFDAAAKDKGMKVYAKASQAATLELAERALLVREWLLLGGGPSRREGEFWTALDARRVVRDAEGAVTSVELDTWLVRIGTADGFVSDRFARAVVLKRLSLGRAPDPAALAEDIDEARGKSLRSLQRRHGKPAVAPR